MLATWLDMWGVKAAFHHVVVCIARYVSLSVVRNVQYAQKGSSLGVQTY